MRGPCPAATPALRWSRCWTILASRYHAVIPDFKALRTPDDEAHRALGIYNLPCMPVRTVFDGIEYRVTQDGDRQIVEYDTPAGPLTTVTVYDEAMRAAGVTITHVTRYAFSRPAGLRTAVLPVSQRPGGAELRGLRCLRPARSAIEGSPPRI